MALPPLSLLSFDGGGIRGYASLCILEKLMKKVEVIERDPRRLQGLLQGVQNADTTAAASSFHPHPSPFSQTPPVAFLPCHYFDYIIGTSTGGLIAIMLGRFRMSVDQAKAQYEQLGTTVFGFPRIFHYRTPLFARRCKFSAKRLATAVDHVARHYGGGISNPGPHQGVLFRSPPDLCKTLVIAYAEVYDESEGPRVLDSTYMFRPYDLDAATHPLALNPGRACELAVRVVARATTAAPTYFKPEEFRVPGEQVWRFKDGGMRANNPTLEGVREVRERHALQVDFVISIGTCSRIKPLFERTRAGGVRDLLNDGWYAIRGLTDTRKVHQNISRDYDGVSPGYFRFDDEASPEWKHIKMDEWKGDRANGPGSRTLGKIRQLIDAYLGGSNPILDRKLEQCAEELVKRRRLRQLAADDWERYALGSSFRCLYPGCVNQVPFNSRNQLTQHIQTHPPGTWCEERAWVYNSTI